MLVGLLATAAALIALLSSEVGRAPTVQPVVEVTRIEVDIDADAIALVPTDELTARAGCGAHHDPNPRGRPMETTDTAGIDIVRLADHPQLGDAFWGLTQLWPTFMLEDPIADLYFGQLDRHADHVLLAVDGEGQVLARALGVPFAMGEAIRRPALPSSGWDGVIRWSWLDQVADRPPTHLSALEITVAPTARGTGLAVRMLDALRDSARARGLQGYVAPVRPSRKHLEPDVDMASYVARTRDDGLPEDPWLRLHVRAGGRIIAVCPTSMTISGTLAQWRTWTTHPFDGDGPIEVAGTLARVHVDRANDHAVYVEPNVWVSHQL